MSHNFRIIHFASGGYGLAPVHYSDDIPANAKKGDGKAAEWNVQSITAVEPSVMTATSGEGIRRLKELVKDVAHTPGHDLRRSAFMRPTLEEADLPAASALGQREEG